MGSSPCSPWLSPRLVPSARFPFSCTEWIWGTALFYQHLCGDCCHSRCSAVFFSGRGTLPRPLFLSLGSIHHGNHLGSSPPIPRWSLRLCPHCATLKNAVGTQSCFSCFHCLLGSWLDPVVSLLVGMFAHTSYQGVVFHPAQCQTHFSHPQWCLIVSKAFLRLEEATARWFYPLLFLLLLQFLWASCNCCVSGLWSTLSSECPQRLFIP